MLVYGNAGKQAVIDHWCPEVPPLQPQLINYTTWTELAPWTKQQHGQHVGDCSFGSGLAETYHETDFISASEACTDEITAKLGDCKSDT